MPVGLFTVQVGYINVQEGYMDVQGVICCSGGLNAVQESCMEMKRF